MPTIKKIIRAAELPVDWARGFTNPDQLVVVTISDSDPAMAIAGQHRLGRHINLAAPSEADRQALAAMSGGEQQGLYEQAILEASDQPGRKISKEDIKAASLKLPSSN